MFSRLPNFPSNWGEALKFHSMNNRSMHGQWDRCLIVMQEMCQESEGVGCSRKRGWAGSDWLSSDPALVRRVKSPHYHLSVTVGRKKQCEIGAQERWLIHQRELQRGHEIQHKPACEALASQNRVLGLSQSPNSFVKKISFT